MYNQDYKQLVYQATEATDKHIYQMLLKQHNKDYKLISPENIYCPYDLTQYTENSKDLIEIKTRYNYTFEEYDDISIDTYKINNIMLHKEEESATSAYVCAIYPQSDKIILIDITFLDYDEDDVVQRPAKWHTLDKSPDKNKKINKTFIPLNIKEKKDNHLHTKTYQYAFPNLRETYINTFKKYCKKYKIPAQYQNLPYI